MPNPGDWQQEQLGRESVLMVRQQDDSIKVFCNVCQREGQRLVSVAGVAAAIAFPTQSEPDSSSVTASNLSSLARNTNSSRTGCTPVRDSSRLELPDATGLQA